MSPRFIPHRKGYVALDRVRSIRGGGGPLDFWEFIGDEGECLARVQCQDIDVQALAATYVPAAAGATATLVYFEADDPGEGPFVQVMPIVAWKIGTDGIAEAVLPHHELHIHGLGTAWINLPDGSYLGPVGTVVEGTVARTIEEALRGSREAYRIWRRNDAAKLEAWSARQAALESESGQA